MPELLSTRLYSAKEVRYLLASLMLALLLVAFNQTVLSTALPTIAGDLGGADRIGWIVSGFVLTSTMSMPIYGSFSDIVGRKGLLLLAIAIFAGGSAAAAVAPTMDALIAFRLIQGLGGGGVLVLSQTILADAVPARERAKYAGVFGAVWAVASIVGPLLGGWFTDGPGWSWAFWLNVPLGVIAFMLTLKFVKRSHASTRPRPDLFGILFLMTATTGVVLLANGAGTSVAWNSLEAIALLLCTVIAIVGFVVAQRFASQPVMPLTLFRNRTFVLATSSGLLTGGIAMFAVITYLPVYVQMVQGLGATEAGLILIPMIGSILVSSTVTGLVVTRTGRYKLIPIVGTAMVAFALMMMSSVDTKTSILEVCFYSALMGAGLGTAAQLLVLVVQNAFPANMVGSATAANNYFRQVGAAVGISAVGSFFTTKLAAFLDGARLDGQPIAIDLDALTPTVLTEMPDAMKTVVADAYSMALPPVFLYMVPLAIVASLLLVFLENKPLSVE